MQSLEFDPWVGKIPGEGNGNPLQYACLENPMDRRNGQVTVNGITKTRTQLSIQFRSVAQSCPTLQPHRLQHTRPPCPSPTPRVYSNSCPLSRWCHPTVSSSVTPFFSRLQSCPASGSSPVSQFFTWGGQGVGVSASASVLPMNTQDWSPVGWTGWISLQSKGLSRVFSNTTVKKHQFLSAQLSL